MKLIIKLAVALILIGCSEIPEESRMEKIRYIQELGYAEKLENASKIAPYLEDKDAEVVMSACFFIGYLKARSYMDELVAYLDHEDPQVVNMAASGLAQMVDERDESILPALHGVLSHKFNLARLSAIESIGAIGSKKSLPFLVDIFHSGKSAQKARVVEALGKIGDREALHLLEAYLIEVQKMDHSAPNKGGVRGSDLHPNSLQIITEKAINAIRENNA